MDLYYFSDLDHFLRVETKSEKWHLEHPGRLSRKYDEVPVEKINGMDVYVFGYSVDVANDLLIMKESRYTTIPIHRNLYPEINYVYSGSCTYRFPGTGETVTLEKGDAILLDPDVIFSTDIKGKEDIVINIAMKERYFQNVLSNNRHKDNVLLNFISQSMNRARQEKHYLVCRKRRNNQLIDMAVQTLVYQYFGPRNQDSGILIEEYVRILLYQLISAFYDSNADNTIFSKEDKLIASVLDQLQEDPGSCRLKEIAAENNYNYYYFSGLFKKRTGYNFTQLKRDQQLHKAKELLSSTDMNIDDIGRRCGFSNLTIFYKNFQKKYKMTPKEYRDSI